MAPREHAYKCLPLPPLCELPHHVVRAQTHTHTLPHGLCGPPWRPRHVNACRRPRAAWFWHTRVLEAVNEKQATNDRRRAPQYSNAQPASQPAPQVRPSQTPLQTCSVRRATTNAFFSLGLWGPPRLLLHGPSHASKLAATAPRASICPPQTAALEKRAPPPRTPRHSSSGSSSKRQPVGLRAAGALPQPSLTLCLADDKRRQRACELQAAHAPWWAGLPAGRRQGAVSSAPVYVGVAHTAVAAQRARGPRGRVLTRLSPRALTTLELHINLSLSLKLSPSRDGALTRARTHTRTHVQEGMRRDVQRSHHASTQCGPKAPRIAPPLPPTHQPHPNHQQHSVGPASTRFQPPPPVTHPCNNHDETPRG